MKKMMKKLIKKIKELKIFQKTSCLMVVFMLLFSTFSVSVFAAEGESEAAAQSTETESITDVWTAVMDGIMDLINAAQGVFFETSGGSYSLEYGDPVSTSTLNLSFYPVLNFPDLPVDSSFQITMIPPYGDSLTGSVLIVGPDSVIVGLNGISFSKAAVSVQPDGSLSPFAFYDVRLGDSSSIFISGWSSFFGPDDVEIIVGSSSFELTFIGTLAVLGLALALILLLVYVVVSFIRLRG